MPQRKLPPETRVAIEPNPEEVDDFRWVTRDELREMMDPKSGLRWSPWFRIIAEKFLDTRLLINNNRLAQEPLKVCNNIQGYYQLIKESL